MQVVDIVNISFHPERMKDILVQIHKLKSEVKRIEAEFEKIGLSLTPEFLELSSLIKEINEDLDFANVYLSRSCSFVNEAIDEYTDIDRKIMCLLSKFPSINTNTTDVPQPVKNINSEEKKRNGYLFDMLRTDLKEKPCKLPQNQIFKKYTLKPGKIDEGHNILIRTWSSNYN